jgi:hypothetical protein
VENKMVKKEETKQSKETPTTPATPTTTTGTDTSAPATTTTNPVNAPSTSGSASTTTGANVQSVASLSSPDYSSLVSYNPVTQGANRGKALGAENVSQTAIAQQSTNRANPTKLGVQPITTAQFYAPYNTGSGLQPVIQSQYGVQLAYELATVNYSTPSTRLILPATNDENTYFNPENGAVRTAQQRQNKFVDNNQFVSNPQVRPTAPIPDKIYTRTNLFEQAGQDDNPLSILEGNPFIQPQQQFMPQVNDEFAPRPEYTAFTNNPYIGVHQRSPIQPNSTDTVSQRKRITDWMQEIREHKWFPFAIAGIVILFVITLIRGRN